ncbi:hypothetical protein DXG01_016688 [Tephrocybe rancida]|nr:hypothetical protein DXG01_016688 [Tephrocybe rancida]
MNTQSMVNPGAFCGQRKTYIDAQKNIYTRAVAENCVADTVAKIQHGYIKWYSMNMDEELTLGHLAQVNDNAADPKLVPPSSEGLTDEEHRLAMEVWQAEQDLIKFCMAQLKCCLAYQFWKDHKRAAMDSNVQDAFLTLLQQLTGKGFTKPHRISALNHWQAMDKNWALVDAELVVSDLFKALAPSVRKEWDNFSQEQHHNVVDEWKVKVDAPLSEDPAKIQKYIEAVVPFMQKILELVSKLTGMKMSFMAGGPEPVDGGCLNVISIHAGHTPGNIKMNFGSCECEVYQKEIVPTFGHFLMKCYTIKDCRSRALQGAVLSLSSTIEEYAERASCSRLDDASQPHSPSVPALSASTTPPGSPSAPHAAPPSPFIGGGLPITPPWSPTPTQRLASPQPPCCPPLRSPSPTHSSAPSPSPSPPLSPMQISPSLPITPAQGPEPSSNSRLPPKSPYTAVNSGTTPVEPQAPSLAATSSNTLSNDTPIATWKRLAEAGAMRKHPHQGHDARLSKKLKTAAVSGLSDAPAQLGPHPRPRPLGRQAACHLLPPPPPSRSPSPPPSRSPSPPPSQSPPQPPPRTCPLGRPAACRVLSLSWSPSGSRSPSQSPAQPPACSCTLTTPDPALPEWFESSLAMLKSNSSLGEEWTDLVQFWVNFKSTEAYAGKEYLYTKHCPSFIQEWIKRRRSPTFMPVKAENLKTAEDSMRAWWDAIPREKLLLSGLNGVLSLLVGLFFWGGGIPANNLPCCAAWLHIVTKVHTAFLGL